MFQQNDLKLESLHQVEKEEERSSSRNERRDIEELVKRHEETIKDEVKQEVS